jgi:hypothetical protein
MLNGLLQSHCLLDCLNTSAIRVFMTIYESGKRRERTDFADRRRPEVALRLMIDAVLEP